MQQFKTFFYSLFNSISNPSYYADVLKAKAWFSWKYFLFWNLLAGSALLFYIIPPVIKFNLADITNEVVRVYPAELEIYGGADGIEINQPRPYSIPFPEKWIKGISEERKENIDVNDIPLSEAENFDLVTFETDEHVQGIQDFYDLQSLAVLTESSIYVLDDIKTGEVRVYAMPSFEESFKFSFEDITKLEQKVLTSKFIEQKWYVVTISILALVVLVPLMTWWRIITLLFYSLFIWIVAGFFMKELKLSYSKAFQVGLHSLTLPVLVMTALGFFGVSSSGVWSFVFYMIWTVFILSQLRMNTTSYSRVSKKKKIVKSGKKSSSKKSKK